MILVKTPNNSTFYSNMQIKQLHILLNMYYKSSDMLQNACENYFCTLTMLF